MIKQFKRDILNVFVDTSDISAVSETINDSETELLLKNGKIITINGNTNDIIKQIYGGIDGN